MHCLEYCCCLITAIIISILIIIIIVYHHYYHHYHDYYYHYHCYHQNCYPHLEDHYLKYYLEHNSGNKLVSILTFRQFFTNLTHKKMSTPKTEMKSKYETGSSCTPVNKTRIKNVSCGYSRYTTLSLVSQPAKLQKKTQITFKNNKFTRQRTLSVPEHILLKRLNQFVITANVYLDTIKQS